MTVYEEGILWKNTIGTAKATIKWRERPSVESDVADKNFGCVNNASSKKSTIARTQQNRVATTREENDPLLETPLQDNNQLRLTPTPDTETPTRLHLGTL